MKNTMCRRLVIIVFFVCIIGTSAWAESYIEFGPKVHSTEIGRIAGVRFTLPMLGVGLSARFGLLESVLPLRTNIRELSFLAFYFDFEMAFLFLPLDENIEIQAGLLSFLAGAGVRFDIIRIRGDSFTFSLYNKNHLTFRTKRDIESDFDIGFTILAGLGLDFDDGVGFYLEAGANPASFIHNTTSIGATLGMSIRL